MSVLSLLLLECLERSLYGGQPFFSEHGFVSRYLPIFISQPDRVAVRVDLPFALMVPRIHIRLVRGPFTPGRTVVEGIGIRIYGNQGELAVDYSGDHVLQVFIFVGQLYVWPDLGSGVPQPHRVYVARIYEGPPVSVLILAEMHRGVQGVGVAIGEHPGEPGVLQLLLHPDNGILDGFRPE